MYNIVHARPTRGVKLFWCDLVQPGECAWAATYKLQWTKAGCLEWSHHDGNRRSGGHP